MIQFLEKRLNEQPLPGPEAQLKMSHVGRPKNWEIPELAKKAAVLILLFEKNNAFHTVLMKRTSRFGNDKHKGQVSFPGGQYEPEDLNFQNTALREFEEETGFAKDNVQLLGKLTELYIPVSNFLVQPFVGYSKKNPVFNPDPKEVDELIIPEISQLTNIANHKTTEMEFSNGFKLRKVPYFDVNGHVVWGATSMILSEFVHLLDEVNQDIGKAIQ